MVSIKHRVVLAAMFFASFGMQVVQATEVVLDEQPLSVSPALAMAQTPVAVVSNVQPWNNKELTSMMAALAKKYPNEIAYNQQKKRFDAIWRPGLPKCIVMGLVAAYLSAGSFDVCYANYAQQYCSWILTLLTAYFDARVAYLVYKRFFPTIKLSINSAGLQVPNELDAKWSAIKKLSTLNEAVVTGFSQSWLAFFTRGWFGSSKSKLANKASIFVESDNGFTTKIDAQLLPNNLFKTVYEIIDQVHKGTVVTTA